MAITPKYGAWIELTSCDADFTFTNPINVAGIVLQPSALGDTAQIRDSGGTHPGIKIDSNYGLAYKFPVPVMFTPKFVLASSTVGTTSTYSILFFVQ